MRELSLHILDIAENGITAGANCIHILVEEDRTADLLTVVITDNGHGMPAEKIDKLADPFVTCRTTRRVGLGLSLLAAATERCAGRLSVETEPEAGTRVKATFLYSHIDRAPVGDMAATITTLTRGNPQIEFVYTHIIDGEEFTVDTRELKAEMGHLSVTNPMVIHHLTASNRNSRGQLTTK
jgi:anti-sigma regulatory factor (Ser/Thr protein kinase)